MIPAGPSYLSPNHIMAWVKRRFPQHKLRKGGKEILINNPLVPDHGFNLNISPEKFCVHDWRGDRWAGINPNTGKTNKCTFTRFVQLYLTRQNGTCSYRQALEDILGSREAASIALSSYRQQTAAPVEEESDGLIEPPSGAIEFDFEIPNKLQDQAARYLESRKIGIDKIRKHRMMWRGLDIVWPYYEYDELVYWQARSTIQKRFEFPTLVGENGKSKYLYGFDLIEPHSYVIITEAIMCCQTLGEQTLASGGADLSEAQIRKLKLVWPKEGVVLAADNDIPGIRSILKNATELAPHFNKICYSLPPKVEYVEDGITKFTKDWNDIARYTDEDPRAIMESRWAILDVRARVKLRAMLG